MLTEAQRLIVAGERRSYTRPPRDIRTKRPEETARKGHDWPATAKGGK